MLEALTLESIRYILMNMEDAVCLTDRHGVLKFFNPAAKNLLDLPDGAEGKMKIWEIIPFVEANDDLVELFVAAVQNRAAQRQKVVGYESKSGRVCRVRVSLTYSENHDGFFVIISDLTDLFRVTSAFTRYTSPQIADYVLHTPGGETGGGETREVSILMSDLRGFTAICASLSAEKLVTMLNHYFGMMVDVIERFQGNVIEFLGDGIFVVFNAPKLDPQHAEHAVACAVEMQNAMDEVNRWNRENGYPALEMGIGINSGSVVVGNIGSTHMKYGCVGHNVNLAGRIESRTVGGQVLVSEATRSLLESEPVIRGEQQFFPKGAGECLTIYDIAGLGSFLLRREESAPVWCPVSGAAPLTLHLLDSHKGVSGDTCPCRVTALSEDDRFCLLQADSPLSVRQDVMISIGGDLYAKVVSTGDDGYVLRFTSKPAQFPAWKDSLSFAP